VLVAGGNPVHFFKAREPIFDLNQRRLEYIVETLLLTHVCNLYRVAIFHDDLGNSRCDLHHLVDPDSALIAPGTFGAAHGTVDIETLVEVGFGKALFK